jgi:hypothetical protein
MKGTANLILMSCIDLVRRPTLRIEATYQVASIPCSTTGCRRRRFTPPLNWSVGPLIKLDKRYYHGYTKNMKTAISIPDKLFRSADSFAKRLGLSRSQLYSTAISEYLSKHQSQQVTERLNSIYAEEDSSLPSSLIRMQAKSWPQEKW